MSVESGYVVNVYMVYSGSALFDVVIAGATYLPVADAYDFDEEGGTLSLNGVEYLYTGIARGNVDLDEQFDRILLSTPMPVGADIEDFVSVVPASAHKIAQVQFDDEDEGIVALVPFEMASQMDTGVRDRYHEERVVVTDEDGRWVISRMDEETPTVLGPYVDPTGLPDPIPIDPPAVSPAPTVYGTVDGLVVQTEDIAPGTQLNYHISTLSGFTPDGSTIAINGSRGTVGVITHMPDGSPLQHGVEYFVVIEAFNSAGVALPSAEALGTLNADNVSQIVAAQIVAGFILAGNIQVGTQTWNPDSGFTIPQPDGGVINLPANGVDYAQITAHIVAQSLDVKDNLSISGNGQVNGTLTLRDGITKPAFPPTLSLEWPKVIIPAITSNGTSDNQFTYNGLTQDLNLPNTSLAAIAFVGGGIRGFDRRSGVISYFPDPTNGKSWCTNFDIYGGIAADAQKGVYHVLGRDRNRDGDWYVYAINKDTWNKVGEIYFWTDANVASYYPRVGYYNNTLAIIWAHTNGQVVIKKRPVTGTSSAISYGSATDTNVEAISARHAMGALDIGTFDSPSSQACFIYAFADTVASVRMRQWSAPGSNPTGMASSFLRANTALVRGMHWAVMPGGDRFVHLDNYGFLHHYSGMLNTTSMQGAQSWFDPQSTTATWDETVPNATGTHETEVGPSATLSWNARAWLSVSTSPAPDETNTDPSNQDKANASRAYVGSGSGTKYLYGTLGKSVRTVSVVIDDDFPTQARAWTTAGVNAFTPEDIGATITGTNIPGGTQILGIVSNTAGQVITLSQAHTATGAGSTITATVSRSGYGRKVWTKFNIIASGKTPETSNGFLTAAITPGLWRTAREDAQGALARAYGDGSGRLGPMFVDNQGRLVGSAQAHLRMAGTTSHNSSGNWLARGGWDSNWDNDPLGTPGYYTYSNGTVTFHQAGYVETTASLNGNSSWGTTGRAGMRIRHGSYVVAQDLKPACNSVGLSVASETFPVTAGSVLTLEIFQDSGATKTYDASGHWGWRFNASPYLS